MGAYKNILFAADLIERDDNAVTTKVAEISRETGAKLSLIHVLEYPYAYGIPYESPTLVEWQQEFADTAKSNLEKLAQELGISPSHIYLVKGQAPALILETAAKIKADLIIVGSHGRHGFGLFLMGSTATAVLHGANCDVLAIRVDKESKKHKK